LSEKKRKWNIDDFDESSSEDADIIDFPHQSWKITHILEL